MTFAELICHVARLRFDDEAQIGVRVSPVVISPREALEIPVAARGILAPNTFVAVACPGVDPWEDDRTCVADGEHAAERATFWRNRLATEAGDRILYVSARRLGRAGGLQDTLFDLSEARLRQGFLEWCRSPGSRCPPEIAEALASSGVAEVADARALAAFSGVVFGAPDPLRAAGEALPMLSLARDSALSTSPEQRLRENVRWVRAASAGDSRGLSRLSDQAAKVRQSLAEVTAGASGEDLVPALSNVDIGALTLDELSAPAPKPRSPAKPKAPKPPKAPPPARPAPPRPPAPTPSEAGAPAAPEAAPEAPPLARPTGARGAPAGTSAPHAAPTGEALSTSEGARGSGDEPGPSDGLRDEPDSTPTEAPPDPAVGSTPAPDLRPPPGRRRATRIASGPWTAAMHHEELGTPAALPDGLRGLLARAVASPPAELLWRVAGDDPSRVLLKRPRGLGEPATPAAPPAGLADGLSAWSATRSALVESLGGSDAVVDRLWTAPYTALGAPSVVANAAAAVEAGLQLLQQAAALGPAALAWAIGLETVRVSAATGPESIALTPLHPLWLGQVLDRLPLAAEAAAAGGLRRMVLAQGLARPLATPSAWPSRGPALQPSSPAPHLLGFSTERRSLAAQEVTSLTAAVVQRYLTVTPHASVGLRVAVDGADVDAVVEGVLSAVGTEPHPTSRVWVHAPRPVATADSGGGPPATYLSSPTPDERPHLVVRVIHGAPEPATTADRTVDLYVRAINAVSTQPCAAVRAASGAVDLGSIGQHPASEDATWEVTIAPGVRGAARRGSFVLLRESAPTSEAVVTSRDTRSASRELQGVMESMGVADTRPKTIRALAAAIASGSSGVLSLASPTERQVASLLLEHTLLEQLGDDAAVVHLTDAQQRLWLGAPRDGWGAFAAAATPRNGRLHLLFGYAAIAGALQPEELVARLTRPGEVLEVQSGLGEVTAGLLASMTSRSDEVTCASLLAAARAGIDLAFTCLVPPGHGWTSGGRIGKALVPAQVADRALLERTMMAAGRRSFSR